MIQLEHASMNDEDIYGQAYGGALLLWKQPIKKAGCFHYTQWRMVARLYCR